MYGLVRGSTYGVGDLLNRFDVVAGDQLVISIKEL